MEYFGIKMTVNPKSATVYCESMLPEVEQLKYLGTSMKERHQL